MKLWKISTSKASIDAGRAQSTIYVPAATAEEAAQKISGFIYTFLSCSAFDIEETDIEVNDELDAT